MTKCQHLFMGHCHCFGTTVLSDTKSVAYNDDKHFKSLEQLDMFKLYRPKQNFHNSGGLLHCLLFVSEHGSALTYEYKCLH
jgi:hypothetical protein